MSVQMELERLTSVKRKGKEADQDFMIRIVKALNDVPDKQYNKLSDEAQKWAEDATKAFNDEGELPDFPAEDEEETDADESEAEEETEAEDEPEEESEEEGDEPEEPEDDEMPATQETESRGRKVVAPPKKARSSKTSRAPAKINQAGAKAGKAGSALTYVRQLLIKNADMSVDDLAEKVKAKGFAVSKQTLHTTRSGFRRDIRFLQEAGLLKKDMI